MIVNIVMLVKDRPRLTDQAITSLYKHTERGTYNLTILNDASQLQARGVLDLATIGHADDTVSIHMSRSKGIVGLARNMGIRAAETYWGRGDFLYLSDNDAYFTPGWLGQLTNILAGIEQNGWRLLGGYTHPYHHPKQVYQAGVFLSTSIEEHDAIGGFSQLMRWETWDQFGPFDAHAVGVCQSEDWAFCQRIRAGAGFKVGCISPHVVLNCGLTNTFGQPAVGHEAMQRYPGVVME